MSVASFSGGRKNLEQRLVFRPWLLRAQAAGNVPETQFFSMYQLKDAEFSVKLFALSIVPARKEAAWMTLSKVDIWDSWFLGVFFKPKYLQISSSCPQYLVGRAHKSASNRYYSSSSWGRS